MKENCGFVGFIYVTMIDLNRICKKQEADYCTFKRALRRKIIVVYDNNCVPECIFNEFPIVVLFFVIRI